MGNLYSNAMVRGVPRIHKEYLEFIYNPLFITDESYAGVYIPTLSQEVVNGMQEWFI